MKKLFIKLEDIAAAEYIPRDTPSFGVSYPPRLEITLKQGGVLIVNEANNGGLVFQEWYDLLFLTPC